MKFERTEVFNIKGALHGMRNPLASWSKSDTTDCRETYNCMDCPQNNPCELLVHVGDNDLKLAQKLIKAGSEHRKALRQIFVSVDITAPLFWWKEADTYKVGTTANSTSTMHKLASTPITVDCFEMGDFEDMPTDFYVNEEGKNGLVQTDTNYLWLRMIEVLEGLRVAYNQTKDKRYWKELIRMLPQSWLQTRTVTMNYEVIRNMYWQRRNHKLTEWSVDFVNWVKTLPLAEEFIMLETAEQTKIKELEDTIESMKCCSNCKHEYYSFGDDMCDQKDCIDYCKWELKSKRSKD